MNMKKGMGQQWTLRMIKLCLKIVRQVNDGVRYTYSSHRRFNDEAYIVLGRRKSQSWVKGRNRG